MNKYHGIKSLAEKYAEKHGVTQKCAEERVREMIDLLAEGLADPEYNGVQFIDVLTMKKVIRKAKVGRNPITKIEVPIPERVGIKVEIGKSFASKLK